MMKIRQSTELMSFIGMILGLLLACLGPMRVQCFHPSTGVLTSASSRVISVSLGTSTSLFDVRRLSLLSPRSIHDMSSSLRAHEAGHEDDIALNRRSFLGAAGAIGTAITYSPAVVYASDESTSSDTSSSGMVSPASVARRLNAVPTFTIVDKRGVPFMVFGEDAKLTAYFFTTFDEARRILDVAIASSDKSLADLKQETKEKRKAAGLKPFTKKEEEEELGINPWREARILTVPLDFAVTLATKSGKQRGGSVYFRVSPSEEDVAAALELDSKSGKTELPEGKVPLFYFEDFKIPRSTVLGGRGIDKDVEIPEEVSPVYFSKSALLEAYKRSPEAKGGNDLPEIKVSELLSVVTTMVDPDTKDEDLKSLVFVPPAGSAKRAKKECEKKGGKEQPFIIGERIVAY